MSSQNEARRPSGCMPGPVIEHHGGLSTRVGAIWSHGLPCGISRCGTQVPALPMEGARYFVEAASVRPASEVGTSSASAAAL
jgi:hypothetical protein